MKKFVQLFTDEYKTTAQGIFFKNWIQRRGDHGNMKCEHVQNSIIDWYRHFCLYLTFKSPLVTGCTNKLNILIIVRSSHTVFMCFVFISEQTATYAIYIKN
jgi:hypothetical protein